MPSLAQKRYTIEEYLAKERQANYKSEYYSGEIHAMAGASLRHNIIVANLMRELGSALRDSPCQPIASDQRVYVQETGLNTYPDIVVLCDEPEFFDSHLDTLINPTLIIEVLSPSTEAYDRGEKFAHYRRLASFKEFLLVSQDKIRVEQYVRHNGLWTFMEFDDPDAVIKLHTLDIEILLGEIYKRVNLTPLIRIVGD